jgi:integrase
VCALTGVVLYNHSYLNRTAVAASVLWTGNMDRKSLSSGLRVSQPGVADMAKRAMMPGLRLHDLRHTHASILLTQGTHPKVVQKRLGHSSIAITLDTNSRVVPGLQEAAARAIDEALTREEVPVTSQ